MLMDVQLIYRFVGPLASDLSCGRTTHMIHALISRKRNVKKSTGLLEAEYDVESLPTTLPSSPACGAPGVRNGRKQIRPGGTKEVAYYCGLIGDTCKHRRVDVSPRLSTNSTLHGVISFGGSRAWEKNQVDF